MSDRPDLAGLEPLLRRHYVDQSVVDAILASLNGLGSQVGDERWAAEVTRRMQEASGDPRLRLSYSVEPMELAETSVDATAHPADPAARARLNRDDGYGVGAVERLSGNVGLLRMRGFVEAAASGGHLVAAMTLLSTTDALLLDLRSSRGGATDAVQMLCSWFFDRSSGPVHLNDVVEDGGASRRQSWTVAWLPIAPYVDRPVYVLTGGRTFSAAEECAYNLQALGRATVVGEPTRGGANQAIRVPLTRHFSLGLPHARSVNPVTGTNWEGDGVRPDVEVPEAEAETVAYRAALEAVVAAAEVSEEVRSEARLVVAQDQTTVVLAGSSRRAETATRS